jgi:hypothetical protein
MPGRVTFNIKVRVTNGEIFPELANRLKDFRPVFEVVIKQWARGNVDKFRQSMGMEATGAAIDPNVFWMPLAESTMRGKRKRGSADQIMVDSGALMQALTDPSGFWSEMTAQQTVFGTPGALEDELKVRYNQQTRQAIFLGADDQVMIEEKVQSYLSLGPDFEKKRFEAGLSAIYSRDLDAEMSMDFGGEQ